MGGNKEVQVHLYENIDSPEQMNRRTLPPLSIYVSIFSLAVVDDSILLISGCLFESGPSGSCHALNTVKSCWDTYKLPSLNTPRFYHSAVAFNNQVYAVCGLAYGGY